MLIFVFALFVKILHFTLQTYITVTVSLFSLFKTLRSLHKAELWIVGICTTSFVQNFSGFWAQHRVWLYQCHVVFSQLLKANTGIWQITTSPRTSRSYSIRLTIWRRISALRHCSSRNSSSSSSSSISSYKITNNRKIPIYFLKDVKMSAEKYIKDLNRIMWNVTALEIKYHCYRTDEFLLLWWWKSDYKLLPTHFAQDCSTSAIHGNRCGVSVPFFRYGRWQLKRRVFGRVH